jgi:hypothetical protein
MMNRSMFLLAILMSASLLAGTSAKGTEGVSKRKMDIDDITPLSKDESRALKKMFANGILKLSESTEVTTQPQRRRLSKGAKESKKSKKSPEVEAETASRAEGFDRLVYTESITSSTTTHG